MLQGRLTRPRRVLMTLDAVGGVWRYALDAASALGSENIETVLAGLGPEPSPKQAAEAASIQGARLEWLGLPLDWMSTGDGVFAVPRMLAACAERHGAELMHLNALSQAAGVKTDLPVIAVSHSCVVTWWEAVRGSALPVEWEWQRQLNLSGLRTADAVLVPSRSHGAAVERAYGTVPGLRVVNNASRASGTPPGNREPFVIAAGRWWDEGKNGLVLDRASELCSWPVVMAGATQGPNGQRCDLCHARVVGPLPAADLRRVMQRAAIAAVPSLYEPFGLVALEAALSGCALVLSDIPVFRELWDEAALFVDPDDPAEFAEAIDCLARDAASRRWLAEKALSRALAFGPERQVAELMDAYHGVLAVAPEEHA